MTSTISRATNPGIARWIRSGICAYCSFVPAGEKIQPVHLNLPHWKTEGFDYGNYKLWAILAILQGCLAVTFANLRPVRETYDESNSCTFTPSCRSENGFCRKGVPD